MIDESPPQPQAPSRLESILSRLKEQAEPHLDALSWDLHYPEMRNFLLDHELSEDRIDAGLRYIKWFEDHGTTKEYKYDKKLERYAFEEHPYKFVHSDLPTLKALLHQTADPLAALTELQQFIELPNEFGKASQLLAQIAGVSPFVDIMTALRKLPPIEPEDGTRVKKEDDGEPLPYLLLETGYDESSPEIITYLASLPDDIRAQYLDTEVLDRVSKYILTIQESQYKVKLCRAHELLPLLELAQDREAFELFEEIMRDVVYPRFDQNIPRNVQWLMKNFPYLKTLHRNGFKIKDSIQILAVHSQDITHLNPKDPEDRAQLEQLTEPGTLLKLEEIAQDEVFCTNASTIFKHFGIRVTTDRTYKRFTGNIENRVPYPYTTAIPRDFQKLVEFYTSNIDRYAFLKPQDKSDPAIRFKTFIRDYEGIQKFMNDPYAQQVAEKLVSHHIYTFAPDDVPLLGHLSTDTKLLDFAIQVFTPTYPLTPSSVTSLGRLVSNKDQILPLLASPNAKEAFLKHMTDVAKWLPKNIPEFLDILPHLDTTSHKFSRYAQQLLREVAKDESPLAKWDEIDRVLHQQSIPTVMIWNLFRILHPQDKMENSLRALGQKADLSPTLTQSDYSGNLSVIQRDLWKTHLLSANPSLIDELSSASSFTQELEPLKRLGYETPQQALDSMAAPRQKAHERNIEEAQSGSVTVSAGDLIKGVKSPFFPALLNDGLNSNELFGNESDMTPYDADFSRVLPQDTLSDNAAINFHTALANSLANSYGDIMVIVKEQGQFRETARTQYQKDQTRHVQPVDRDDSQYELFASRYLGERHWAIRSGLPSTEISAVVVNPQTTNPLQIEAMKYFIAQKGLYIPITDQSGRVLFSPQEYDSYSFSMSDVGDILHDDKPEPSGIVAEFKKNPFFKSLFNASAGVSEGYTLEEHTGMVLGQFEKYYAKNYQSPILSREAMRAALALHDIGKPYARSSTGSTHEQHYFTRQIMNTLVRDSQLKRSEMHIAAQLVSQDHLGSYIKGQSSIELTARRMMADAKDLSVSIQDYFKLLEMYYMCDASSYTSDASYNDPEGKTLQAKDSLDELFVISEESIKLNTGPQARLHILKEYLSAE